jgi:thioredoxin reductase (NADPH)
MIRLEDVIIIGSGPAGMSAAIYAARADLNPLLLTGQDWGGQACLTDHIENYPGFPDGTAGLELIRLMQEQATRFGARVVMDWVTEVNLRSHPFHLKTQQGEYQTRSLIIATGVSPRRLGVSGEDRFIGKGVSFCATCDGCLYKGQEVAVVGGGNTALKEALYLTRMVDKVYIIHRRNQLRADPILQRQARASEKIEFIWDSVVTEVKGTDKMSGLTLRNVKTGEESELSVPGVFVYIGSLPNTDLFKGQLVLYDTQHIVTNRHMHTSREGVFAAGDVQERVLGQVVTATATGAIAAIEAEKYLAELDNRTYTEWADYI